MHWFPSFMFICVFVAGHKIDCFECNSWNDPRYCMNFVSLKMVYFWRCGDPFNYTLNVEDMPAIKKCEGCCVKLVQKIGTPLYSVRRTCTDDLGMHNKQKFQTISNNTLANTIQQCIATKLISDINLWLVDHVCMAEGGGKGHMCFCEHDDCNSVRKQQNNILFVIGLLLVNIQFSYKNI